MAIALLTAGMGVTDNPHAWLALRALAGIASAWALVFGSAWVPQRLAAMTAAFAIGQILGPALVSIVAGYSRGMDLPLVAASVVLALGAVVLIRPKQ